MHRVLLLGAGKIGRMIARFLMDSGDYHVLVGDVSGGSVWLTATVSAPLDADVIQLGSDVREAALGALGEAGFLAA